VRHALVSMAVGGELVSPLGDRANELGVALRRQPEHEERGSRAEVVEQRKQGVRLALERRAAAIPVGATEPLVHELVPVLEVDAEEEHGRTLVAN
jgi:hypothetical protein